MNNLPLQPLVWFERKDSNMYGNIKHCAQGAGIFYTIMPTSKDVEVCWGDSIDGSYGHRTLRDVADAKEWVKTDHYPSKMQPYVKPMLTWIDINKQLPDKNTTVLVVYHCHFDNEEVTEFDVCTAFFDGETFDPKDQLFYTKRNTTVTHWMPIPEFSTMQNLHKGGGCDRQIIYLSVQKGVEHRRAQGGRSSL